MIFRRNFGAKKIWTHGSVWKKIATNLKRLKRTEAIIS